MTLIDKLIARSTGMYAPTWSRSPLSVAHNEGETGRTNTGTDRNTEHELALTVTALFWANRAQYSDARKIAERILVRELYRDLAPKIDAIVRAINDDNKNAAMNAALLLRDAIDGRDA